MVFGRMFGSAKKAYRGTEDAIMKKRKEYQNARRKDREMRKNMYRYEANTVLNPLSRRATQFANKAQGYIPGSIMQRVRGKEFYNTRESRQNYKTYKEEHKARIQAQRNRINERNRRKNAQMDNKYNKEKLNLTRTIRDRLNRSAYTVEELKMIKAQLPVTEILSRTMTRTNQNTKEGMMKMKRVKNVINMINKSPDRVKQARLLLSKMNTGRNGGNTNRIRNRLENIVKTESLNALNNSARQSRIDAAKKTAVSAFRRSTLTRSQSAPIQRRNENNSQRGLRMAKENMIARGNIYPSQNAKSQPPR